MPIQQNWRRACGKFNCTMQINDTTRRSRNIRAFRTFQSVPEHKFDACSQSIPFYGDIGALHWAPLWLSYFTQTSLRKSPSSTVRRYYPKRNRTSAQPGCCWSEQPVCADSTIRFDWTDYRRRSDRWNRVPDDRKHDLPCRSELGQSQLARNSTKADGSNTGGNSGTARMS